MGADIHFVIEQKHNDSWIGVYSTDSPIPRRRSLSSDKTKEWESTSHWPELGERNYEFFGNLAGVRREGPEPNGIPDDASQLTQLCSEYWSGDGHSHGHCDLDHFCRTWLEANPDLAPKMMRDKTANPRTNPVNYHFPYLDRSTFEHFRVVFWFDN